MNSNLNKKFGNDKNIAKKNTTDAHQIIPLPKPVDSPKEDYQYREEWKSVEKAIRWTAKVDLYHLDGTTNYIKVTMPIMTGGGIEELQKYLSAWVKELTVHFIQISHFKISMGSISEDGKETYSFFYKEEVIPMDKVWVINVPLGIWISPEEVLKGRLKIYNERSANGEHPTGEPYPFPYSEKGKYPKVKL